MNKKHFLIVFLVLSVFLAGCGTGSSGEPPVPQKIFQNIITLQFLHNWGILEQPIDPIEGFTRFLLLILVFAVLFKLAELLKLGRNIAIVIALVVSFMTAIFIPGTVLLTIGTSYGTLFSLLFLALPIAGGIAAYFFLKDYAWLRVIVIGATLWILDQMQDYLTTWYKGATSAYDSIVSYVVGLIGYVEFVLWIILLISLVQALMSFASGHTGNKLDAKNTAQWIYNKAKGGERRKKTALLNEYIEEEKELKLLDEALVARNEAVDYVSDILRVAGGFKNEVAKNMMIGLIEAVANKLHDAKREFRRVNKRTWRQETRFQDLIKEFKDKSKDVKRLEVLENDVLQKHKEAIDALDKAIDAAEDLVQAAQKEASTHTAFPSPFTGADKAELAKIKNGLAGLDISKAEQAQKEAIQAVQGIVTEARELMKWK